MGLLRHVKGGTLAVRILSNQNTFKTTISTFCFIRKALKGDPRSARLYTNRTFDVRALWMENKALSFAVGTMSLVVQTPDEASKGLPFSQTFVSEPSFAEKRG